MVTKLRVSDKQNNKMNKKKISGLETLYNNKDTPEQCVAVQKIILGTIDSTEKIRNYKKIK